MASNLPATIETASSEKSTEGSALARLAALPARLDDDTLGKIEQYAASAPPALPQTDQEHMLQFIRLMSDMPRQGSDAATGLIKVENMLRHLGHLPRACINWLMDQVHARFTFYPSIKELLDLAKEWGRDDEAVRARAKAEVIARNERQARLDDHRDALREGTMDQGLLDGVSARVKRILEAETLVFLCRECGAAWPRRPLPDLESTETLADIAARHGGFPAEQPRHVD